MDNDQSPLNNASEPASGEIVLYSAPSGDIRVECLLREETIWLTQQQIADLFGVDKSGVSRHLKNIYDESELDLEATVAKIATVQAEGSRQVTRQVDHHNLDAIIAVGYRVSSYQATQFRIWATKTLKEFMIKGFVLDDDRLKQGKTLFGKDYFEELLERIREIRASERRFYQKITDIYALAVDYDKNAPVTREFFATVQNKLPLGDYGKDGGRDDLRFGRCEPAEHWAGDMEERTGWQDPQIRRVGRQELPQPGSHP